MASVVRTLAHAARRLRRTPAFAVAAVLTLTLGIGATTAVFSVVNAVVLRPLPYPESDRLVDLSHTLEVSGILRVDQSDATFLHYRRGNGVFSGVVAYRVTAVNVAGLSGASAPDAGRAERVIGGRVSANTFAVLRGVPLYGRTLDDNDDVPTAARVVVIGQRFWERNFGAEPSVDGRDLVIDGTPHRVVGVMGAGFGLPDTRTDLWVPLRLDPTRTASAAFDYRGIARLRDGVSLEAARADLQRLLPQVPVAFPGRLTVSAIEQTKMRSVVRPLRDVVVGDVGRVLWIVFGAVACLLLVACANVMNLFLVRAEQRQHELAVRRALGAAPWMLAREHVVEAIVVATIGGVLGLVLGVVAVRALQSFEGVIDVPRLAEVDVDMTVLTLAAGVTVLSMLLVTVLPSVRAAATTGWHVLGDASRTATASRARHRARHALVGTQVALAVVLLAGAALMARSYARLRAVPPGFNATNTFGFRVALSAPAYGAPGEAARFIERALSAIGSVAGVQAAGAVSKLPLLEESRRDTALFVEERPLEPGAMPAVHQVVFASPDYFRAMGIALTEGNTFDHPDPGRARRDVIVSRALADRYWPGESVVGKRVRMAPVGPWSTITGVTGSVRGTALDAPPDEIIYLPLVVALGGGRTAAGALDVLWTPREIA